MTFIRSGELLLQGIDTAENIVTNLCWSGEGTMQTEYLNLFFSVMEIALLVLSPYKTIYIYIYCGFLLFPHSKKVCKAN